MELQYEDIKKYLIKIDKEYYCDEVEEIYAVIYYFLKKYTCLDIQGLILGYCYARELGYDETFEDIVEFIDASRIITDGWYED